MNAQSIGNICAGLAGLLYAFPLQYLLMELSRKRDDGGGAIAALAIVTPMWLLLLVGVFCVTISGGFDWLRLNRTALHTLTIAGTLSLAVISLLRFEILHRAGFIDRIIQVAPIHLFPIATLVVIVLSLNPRFASIIPPAAFRWLWVGFATASLVACLGFLGHRVVAKSGSQVSRIAHFFRSNTELDRTDLARIPTLDPERDFDELLRLTNEFHGQRVREAALARLRSDPGFITNLVTALQNGSAEHALGSVEFATFTVEEQQMIVLPVRDAMERIIEKTHSEIRYMPEARRKATRRWGNHLFASIAARLDGTGVDFKPALADFDECFAPRKSID